MADESSVMDCIQETMVDVPSESMPVLERISKKIEDSSLKIAERRNEDVDSRSAGKTIFPIPSLVRQTNPGLYEPTLLSIGPYHRDNPDLRAFDHRKALCLENHHFRYNTSSLEACVTAVTNLEPTARSRYEDTETFRPLSRDDLVQLLVMDGCFIIHELYFKFFFPMMWWHVWRGQSQLIGWTDLLKLENQIPFFVLEALFEVLLYPKLKEKSSQMESKQVLRYLAVKYLTDTGPEPRIPISRDPRSITEEVHHLLHLYYLCLTPHPQEEEEESNWILRYTLALADSLFLFPDILMAIIFSPHRLLRCIFMKASSFFSRQLLLCFSRQPLSPSIQAVVSSITVRSSSFFNPQPPSFFSRRPPSLLDLQPSITIPCAAQLQEDGVKFVKKRKCTSLYDVTFSGHRGIMRIPQLSIHSDSAALFANLIHYEQRLRERHEKYMTSYVFLMDCLVKSPRDAAALRKSEIIVSEQDDEKVVEFFNQIRGFCDVTSDVTMTDYYIYSYLSDQVKEYRKFKLFRWRAYFAQLKRDYFGSPWTLISFLAALILLCLTIVQTFFTIYPYYYPPPRS